MYCVFPGQAQRKESFYYEWHNCAHCELPLVENLLAAWFMHVLHLARCAGWHVAFPFNAFPGLIAQCGYNYIRFYS